MCQVFKKKFPFNAQLIIRLDGRDELDVRLLLSSTWGKKMERNIRLRLSKF